MSFLRARREEMWVKQIAWGGVGGGGGGGGGDGVFFCIVFW